MIVDSGVIDLAGVDAALRRAGFRVVGLVHGMSDLYQHVRELAPDAIVIASDAPQRDSLEDIAVSARHAPAPVIMLAGSATDDIIRRAVAGGLSFYVTPEMPPALIRSLVETAVSHHQQAQVLTRNLDQTRRQLDDQRAVSEAKCQLMERHSCSEAEAYHRLRRTAMDQGKRIADIARVFLDNTAV